MKKYKSILRDNNGEVKREFAHDTKEVKPTGFDEYLEQVKAEVERIGKGYTCNFMYRGENIHHINGANHFCFSLEGHKVHPLSVGGSRFCYPNDFSKEEFIAELKNILLTNEECNAVYRGIWNEMTK